jgi:hypothetical protein
MPVPRGAIGGSHRSVGGHGERVETTEGFQGAFERALASRKPAILHCLLDPQAINSSADDRRVTGGGDKELTWALGRRCRRRTSLLSWPPG